MSCSPPLQMEARPSEVRSGEIWARMDISAAAFGQHKEPKHQERGHGQGGNPRLRPPNLRMASPRAQRELAHEMAGLVTSIFNSSIELGEAPSDWRRANCDAYI